MIKTTLKIEGMACGMCEAHIRDVIRRTVPQAKKVAVSHGKGKAAFVSEEAVDEEHLRKAIDETGYRVLEFSTSPYEKEGWFGRK